MTIRWAERFMIFAVLVGALLVGLCIPIRLIDKPVTLWLLLIGLILLAAGSLVAFWLMWYGWQDPDNWIG